MTWDPDIEYERIKERLVTDSEFRKRYDNGVSGFGERDIKAVAGYLAIATPLLEELAQLGYVVAKIGSLGYRYERFDTAIPLLIDWARRLQHGRVWSDIISTISKPWAKETVGPFLVEMYPRTEAKWRPTIASCLPLVTCPAIESDLIRLVEDVAREDDVWCRERILAALAPLKTARVETVLRGFRSDPEEPVRLIVAKSLAKFSSPAAVDALRELSADSNSDVAKMAQASLNKIEKKATKESAKSRKH